MTPNPDDLVAVAELCGGHLLELENLDWDAPVAGLDWSCRETLGHLASLAYASVLATRLQAARPLSLVVREGASVDELVWTTRALALVLAEVARAAPAEARAFHPAGMADATGFVAMGMDELLVHTNDIDTALGGGFEAPKHLVVVVLDRLFPWWPRDEPPWNALLWCNGRSALPGRENPGASWLWQCAPLDEWDGRVPTWDPINHRPA